MARWVNAQGLLGIAVVLGAWEFFVGTGVVTFEYLPAPTGVAVALIRLLASGEMIGDAEHTLAATLLGWIVACTIGIGLGLALGFSNIARRYGMASVELLRPIPGIALLPLALLLFNFSLSTELMVIIYTSVWPVLVNTAGGIMDVSSRLHDVGRTLHLGRIRFVTKVLTPAAVPSILVGCRLSMSIALIMAIIAEMIGNPHGLGYAIVREEMAIRPKGMFAYILFVGVLGIALNALFVSLTERAFPGHFGRAPRHE